MGQPASRGVAATRLPRVCLAWRCFTSASMPNTAPTEAAATIQPAAGGGACPSWSAIGATKSTKKENANSTEAPTISSRLVVQPSAPGHLVAPR